MSQATLSLRERNPDILSCIANLSDAADFWHRHYQVDGDAGATLALLF